MASSDPVIEIAPPRWRALGQTIWDGARTLSGAALICAIVLGGGVWSSNYTIKHGSFLSTDFYGVWDHWRNASHESADPYTRAHFLLSGQLPTPSETGSDFEARTDDTGARLHSSCNYSIQGQTIPGAWWSLTVYDDDGRLIANSAGRHTFTSETVAASSDGTYVITLGRDARPGNWLPTGGAGRLVVIFSVKDAGARLAADQRGERADNLPLVHREGCS